MKETNKAALFVMELQAQIETGLPTTRVVVPKKEPRRAGEGNRRERRAAAKGRPR